MQAMFCYAGTQWQKPRAAQSYCDSDGDGGWARGMHGILIGSSEYCTLLLDVVVSKIRRNVTSRWSSESIGYWMPDSSVLGNREIEVAFSADTLCFFFLFFVPRRPYRLLCLSSLQKIRGVSIFKRAEHESDKSQTFTDKINKAWRHIAPFRRTSS